MKIAFIIYVWLAGIYVGYSIHPPRAIERRIKVICIPDKDTEAKLGDSIEVNVDDYLIFKRKITKEL